MRDLLVTGRRDAIPCYYDFDYDNNRACFFLDSAGRFLRGYFRASIRLVINARCIVREL